MGMFDYLYIDKKMLPISKKDKKALGTKPDFQTKDFDLMLSTIIITKDGFLIQRKFEYGWDSTKKNAFGSMGVLTNENKRDVVLNEFSGSVNFYTTIDSYPPDEDWFEFNAIFKDGKLKEITRVKLEKLRG